MTGSHPTVTMNIIDNMDIIENRQLAADTARLFQHEILRVRPDIPPDELHELVFEYLFYRTSDLSRAAVHLLVDEACCPSLPAVRRRLRLRSAA